MRAAAIASTVIVWAELSRASAQTPSLSAAQLQELRGTFSSGTLHRFGRDILLDGDTAIVLYGTFINSYRAQEFTLGSTGWTFRGELPVAGASAKSVDFRGNLMLWGIPGAGPTASGRVGVVRRSAPGSWTQTFLEAPDPNTVTEFFGSAIAIDGTTVVISNYTHTQTLQQEGAVYVYEDTGTNLVLRHSFYGDYSGRRLGFDVSLDGNDLLVTGASGSAGSVLRAFLRENGAWHEAQTSVTPLPPTAGYVELDGGSAVVHVGSGNLMALASAGDRWFVDSMLPAPPTTDVANDFDVFDGVIAASIQSEDTAAFDAGAVRLYARNDGWKLQATLTASDAGASDYFGALDLRGERLIVGAFGHDHFGNDEGAAYAFELAHAPAQVYCVPELTSLDCVAHIGFQGTPSATSAAAFTLTASNVLSHRAGALVYGTSGRTYQPYPGGIRCLAPPRHVTARQSSGGTAGTFDCSGALATDFNAFVQSGVDPSLAAGVQVNAQWIFRDPNGLSALASTEAIEFTIAP